MNTFFKLLGFIVLFSGNIDGTILGIGLMIIGYLKDIIDKLNER
jgi:hypothetical protein